MPFRGAGHHRSGGRRAFRARLPGGRRGKGPPLLRCRNGGSGPDLAEARRRENSLRAARRRDSDLCAALEGHVRAADALGRRPALPRQYRLRNLRQAGRPRRHAIPAEHQPPPRALEGELARTIASIQGVEKARVHLVLPERQLFTQDKQSPSASIVLTVKGGQLTQGQVRAVRNLVASAVLGALRQLRDDRRRLRPPARGGGGRRRARPRRTRWTSARPPSRTACARKSRKSSRASSAPARRAQVAADIDFNRVTSTSQTYDPEGRVVRETNSTEEKTSSAGAGGGSSTASRNLPDGAGTSAGGGGDLDRARRRKREVRDLKHHQDRDRRRRPREAPSVAVAVDGTTAPGADGKPGEWAARSPEDLARITTLVKSAVGSDEARGRTRSRS